MGNEPASAPPNVRAITAAGFSWVDVERPTKVACDELCQQYGLLSSDVEMALDPRSSPVLVRRERYLLVVVQVPLLAPEGQRRSFVVSQVAMIVRPDLLITIHAGDVRPLTRLFHQLEVGTEARDVTFSSGVEGALFVIVRRLIDVAADARAHAEQATSALEEELLREVGPGMIGSLARRRRELRALQGLVASLPAVIRGIGEVDLGLATGADWEHLAQRADCLAAALEGDVHALRDVIATANLAITSRTASYLRVVAAVAATTLPLIVVVLLLDLSPSNPLAGQANGFAIGLAIAGVVFLGVLLVLKRRGIA